VEVAVPEVFISVLTTALLVTAEVVIYPEESILVVT